MKTRVNLKPGQKGTKGLVEKYGDALICVRYRYDAITNKQYKTAEIIVSESKWTPPPPKFPEGTLVHLKISFKETLFQEQARAAGARWDKQQQVWIVPYGSIAGTKLEKLIVVETAKEVENMKSL